MSNFAHFGPQLTKRSGNFPGFSRFLPQKFIKFYSQVPQLHAAGERGASSQVAREFIAVWLVVAAARAFSCA
ncbi:hypothetical protein [Arthrobacter glacialis]|nr:hypothetical protein [Arthrobacter glacialis]